MNRTSRLTTTTATAASFGLIIVLGASGAAADDQSSPAPVITTTTEVNYTCSDNKSSYGNQQQDVMLNPDTFTATYPQSVQPGETFTIMLQPGEWTTTEQLGRIRYDIALPTMGTIDGVALTNQGANVEGRDAPLSVIRVDEDGNEADDGAFARISAGNLTIDNGPHADNGNNDATGLTAASSLFDDQDENDDRSETFQIPGITITMTAPNTPGAIMTAGLRNAGQTDEVPTLSLLEVRNYHGYWSDSFVNDAINCAADVSAAQLTMTTVQEETVEAVDTSIGFVDSSEITLPYDNPATPEGTIAVNVTTADGAIVNKGQVTFTIGDDTQVVDVIDGVATLPDYVFPTGAAHSEVVHAVTANYNGVADIFNPSSTPQALTVTVEAEPLVQAQRNLELTAIAQNDSIDVNDIPITLTATATATGNGVDATSTPQADQTITFTKNGATVGTAVTNVEGVATFVTSVPKEHAVHVFTASLPANTTDTTEYTDAQASAELTIAATPPPEEEPDTPETDPTEDADTPTKLVPVHYECTADTAFWGNGRQDVIISPDNVAASYPQTVKPGERFTITLQPGEWTTTAELARIRYDIALPQNATIENIELANQGTGIEGIDAAIDVTRVNDSGEQAANGRFARISAGNLTIDNGPKADNGNNGPTGLIAAPGATDDNAVAFQLPGITITLVAPQTPGTTITAGLRSAGTTEQVSTLSLLEIRPGSTYGYNNDAITCTADTAGTTLVDTTVTNPDGSIPDPTDPDPTDPEPTDPESVKPAISTELTLATATDTDSVVRLGDTITLTATYTADSTIPAGSEIVFRRNGTRIGTAKTEQDGQAMLNYRVTHTGTQTFTAFAPQRTTGGHVYANSESSSLTLEVAGPMQYETATALIRTDPDQESPIETNTNVEFTATVTSDVANLEGVVAFYEGDTLIGTAPLDPAMHQAVIRHTFTSAGNRRVHAMYEGVTVKRDHITTGVFRSSTSEPVMVDVANHSIDVSVPGQDTTSGTGTSPRNDNDTSSAGGSSGSILQTLFGLLSFDSIGSFFASVFTLLRTLLGGFSA